MLPLTGIRVLDFTTLMPGPLGTLMFAEAGADVIKVEPPGGEAARKAHPRIDGESVQFAMLNRGKRSVCADLKRDGDRERVFAMALEADVLIEQFRPGVMARLRLDYESLAPRNPRLIYCSVTGFGQSGPAAGAAGHDLTYIARSGLLALGERVDGRPALPPGLIADIGGGTYPAVTAILMALLGRSQSGRGCHIDISMTHATLAWMSRAIATVTAEGKAPPMGGGRHTGGSPRYGVWLCADGRSIAAAPLEDKFWNAFCDVIGLPAAHRGAEADPGLVKAEIAKRVLAETSATWADRFAGKDACVEIVRDIAEVMNDPVFRSRGTFAREVGLASGRTVPALPMPAFARHDTRAAPRLGDVPLEEIKGWPAPQA